MNTNRFNRQILAFGEEGQRRINATRVGIVGAGGIGSQIVQALAYLGTQSFVVIDDDIIDETNLNRLVGANPADVANKLKKVDIARRHLLAVNPEATILPIAQNLRSRSALEALLGCNVIFGCVDHDAPRQVLNELAAAYEIPLFDLATEIFGETKPVQFGGRVVLCRSGDFCLGCAKQIDWERAKQELESSAIQAERKRHGYGLREVAKAPSVVSLNGLIANLAVNEFMAMITGVREPSRFLKYKGERGNVVFNTDARDPECFICGYLSGKGNAANIWRYLKPAD